jgi:hypothetical protein
MERDIYNDEEKKPSCDDTPAEKQKGNLGEKI